jgi:thiol-disulfide isomerase/thioredoxin
MKTILKVVLLVFIGLFFNACDSKVTESTVAEENTKPSNLPKFTLTTTKGEKITLSVGSENIFSKELENKIVLVNFWAPWCEPCRKEMPSFVELQEKYKDDFVILGVLFDKKTTKEEWLDFMKKHNVNFPVTVGDENFVLAQFTYDVKMIPESFLYAKDGTFIKKFIGEISKEKLEKYIRKYLY